MAKKSLEKAIQDTVEKAVESVVEEKLSEEVATDPNDIYTNLDELEETETAETIAKQLQKNRRKKAPTIQHLASYFPSSEGYYAVLALKTPGGKSQIVYHIERLEDTTDPVLFVYQLVKDKNWPSGEYEVRVCKHGTSGNHQVFPVNVVDLDKEVEKQKNLQSNVVSLGHTMNEFSEVIRTAKDLVQPANQPTNDPGKLTDIIANTFSKAIDLTKDNSKTGNSDLIQLFTVMIDKLQSTKKEDGSELINKILEALKPAFEKKEDFLDNLKKAKDVGLIPEHKKEEPKENEEDKLIRLLTVIEKFQDKKEEKPDPLDTLIKLKQAGLIPDKNEVNPMDQFKTYLEMFTSLMGVAQGMNSGGGSSFGIELIKTLGPQVPKIVENVTGTINNFVDFSKKKLEAKGITTNIPLSKEEIVSEPIRQIPQNNVQQKNLKKTEGGNVMEGIINEIKEAIDSRDKKFYPRLTEILHSYVQNGDVIYKDLKAGKLPIDQVVQMLMLYGGTYFSDPKVKIYFQEYVNALRSEYEIICGNCNEIYVYDNREQFINDPNRICESCGNPLKGE